MHIYVCIFLFTTFVTLMFFIHANSHTSNMCVTVETMYANIFITAFSSGCQSLYVTLVSCLLLYTVQYYSYCVVAMLCCCQVTIALTPVKIYYH